jgi:hypothetical protein
MAMTLIAPAWSDRLARVARRFEATHVAARTPRLVAYWHDLRLMPNGTI